LGWQAGVHELHQSAVLTRKIVETGDIPLQTPTFGLEGHPFGQVLHNQKTRENRKRAKNKGGSGWEN